MVDENSDERFVSLRHGAVMPRLGFGTWPLTSAEAERVVAEAVNAGYRLVDTAENYRNEAGVGAGIRASGVPREDLFVTTKFNREWHGEDLVRTALERSVDRLGLDYVDLLLIHWPNPGHDRYVAAWRGLAHLLAEGRVRAIGTSNFKPAHLSRLAPTGVLPDVNQIQLNPFFPRLAERAFGRERRVVTQSWAPLGGGFDADLRDHPVLAAVANRHGRTPGQVTLRWHLQAGLAVVVKSADPRRMRDNLAVFDFTLTPDDIAAIDQLKSDVDPIDSDVAGH